MSGEPILNLVGNMTADPELRVTATGDVVASFTVACTPRLLDRETNTWTNGDTLYLRCAAWRQLAENVAESLSTGTRIWVQGRLKQRSYATRDGDKRTVIELDVDEIGPSLKFAVARVHRANPGGGESSNGETSDAAPAEPDVA